MIRLNSDTETRPTTAMRKVMAEAEVGDEQRGDDPSVNRLQLRVAELLSKEAALFLPSGTLCNLIALKAHTRPGDAVVVEHMAHIVRAESGGAALAVGLMVEPIVTDRGVFGPDALDEALARVGTLPTPYGTSARLVCVEQTHNLGGGTVWPLPTLRAVGERAWTQGMAVHMDGARLMNAAVASGTPAAAFAACVDSLWLDFTKGLGAPLGAVLAGSKEFIAEARRYKQLFGGALRQAGIVAAGCLYALDHHVERLAEDHENARHLAQSLDAIDGIRVRNPEPETNMVFFEVRKAGLDHSALIARLHEAGVALGASGRYIRAVAHLDTGRAEIDAAIALVDRLMAQ